jgi:hypothetical protein
MSACWLTYGYFNVFPNNVNKKMTKKALFLATRPPAGYQVSASGGKLQGGYVVGKNLIDFRWLGW